MPNSPLTAIAPRFPAAPPTGTSSDAVNILMVDDRPENLMALQAILDPLGQNLISAQSGEEALRHLLHTDFALILMDVQMPGMDGFETVRIIKQREKTRHIPIIFITAISKEDRYVFQGYSAGAVDYIFKPFQPSILLSKVAVFVDLYKKTEQIRHQAELIRLGEQREKQREMAELELALKQQHLLQLSESEARLSRFKSTLDATLDGVFIFDGQTLRFSYFNNGALNQLGYTCDELLVMTPLDIQIGIEETTYRQMLQPLLEHQQASLTFETQHRCKNGELVPVETFLQYVAPDGTEGNFVAIVRDITERRRFAESLIQAKEEAERANKAKSEFISSVSHELRTPLNAVIGFSKLLLNPRVGSLNDDQRLYVHDIVNGAEHLLQLINDILDLSKIEAGKLTLDPSPFILSDLLENSLTIVRETALKHNLELRIEMTPDIIALPPLLADQRKVKQIMYNLLSNAVKFTPDGGKILVRAWRQSSTPAPETSAGTPARRRNRKRSNSPDTAGLASSHEPNQTGEERVIISVEDTGIGVAPEHQSRIFGAFEQVDSSYARQQQGTGLGLALTKRLIELHGGHIWLNSTLQQGSTFFFSLPLRFQPEEVSSEVAEIPADNATAQNATL